MINEGGWRVATRHQYDGTVRKAYERCVKDSGYKVGLYEGAIMDCSV